MMERIRYASWRAKTERMSYRHDNQDKTPRLVSFQELMTKEDLQLLGRDVIRFVSHRAKGCRICHRHRHHHETSDLSCFRELFLKCNLGMTRNGQNSLCVVEN